MADPLRTGAIFQFKKTPPKKSIPNVPQSTPNDGQSMYFDSIKAKFDEVYRATPNPLAALFGKTVNHPATNVPYDNNFISTSSAIMAPQSIPTVISAQKNIPQFTTMSTSLGTRTLLTSSENVKEPEVVVYSNHLESNAEASDSYEPFTEANEDRFPSSPTNISELKSHQTRSSKNHLSRKKDTTVFAPTGSKGTITVSTTTTTPDIADTPDVVKTHGTKDDNPVASNVASSVDKQPLENCKDEANVATTNTQSPFRRGRCQIFGYQDSLVTMSQKRGKSIGDNSVANVTHGLEKKKEKIPTAVVKSKKKNNPKNVLKISSSSVDKEDLKAIPVRANVHLAQTPNTDSSSAASRVKNDGESAVGTSTVTKYKKTAKRSRGDVYVDSLAVVGKRKTTQKGSRNSGNSNSGDSQIHHSQDQDMKTSMKDSKEKVLGGGDALSSGRSADRRVWDATEIEALRQIQAALPLHYANYWEIIADQLHDEYHAKLPTEKQQERTADECYSQWFQLLSNNEQKKRQRAILKEQEKIIAKKQHFFNSSSNSRSTTDLMDQAGNNDQGSKRTRRPTRGQMQAILQHELLSGANDDIFQDERLVVDACHAAATTFTSPSLASSSASAKKRQLSKVPNLKSPKTLEGYEYERSDSDYSSDDSMAHIYANKDSGRVTSVAAKADYVNRVIQKSKGARSDLVSTGNSKQKGKKSTHSFTKKSMKTIKKHCDSIYDTKNKFEEIVNIQDGSVHGKVVNVKADISRQNKVKISLEKNNDYDESSSYDDDLSCSDIDEI